MTESSATAILLDDEDEGRSLGRLLHADGLEFIALAPAASSNETVREVLAEVSKHSSPVVLLDYRLDMAAEADYRGGTIAAALKDSNPDVPIVLFTTEDLLRDWVVQRPSIRDLFDWELVKRALIDDKDKAAAEILSIATGYSEIADVRTRIDGDAWMVLADVMRSEVAELEQFRSLEASPPVGPSASVISRWLLTRALRWSGPLLFEADARTVVGIDAAGFSTDEVQGWLASSRYEGAFQETAHRWWYERLREHIDQLFEFVAPTDARLRAAALARVVGRDLNPESCVWCQEFDTVRGCALCGQAVDAVHGLPSLGAPEWALPRVICFMCILRGDADDQLFDDDSSEIAEQIKRGEFGTPSTS